MYIKSQEFAKVFLEDSAKDHKKRDMSDGISKGEDAGKDSDGRYEAGQCNIRTKLSPSSSLEAWQGKRELNENSSRYPYLRICLSCADKN